MTSKDEAKYFRAMCRMLMSENGSKHEKMMILLDMMEMLKNGHESKNVHESKNCPVCGFLMSSAVEARYSHQMRHVRDGRMRKVLGARTGAKTYVTFEIIKPPIEPPKK